MTKENRRERNPAESSVTTRPSDTTALDLSALLGTLGYTPGELVSIGHRNGSGNFRTRVGNPLAAGKFVSTQLPDTADIFFGVNPVRAGRRGRRGNAQDVTRLAALWADLDIKGGGCSSLDVAHAIIDELSGILGTRPSAITVSGNGLHPYWPVSDGRGGCAALAALVKRWGRLVGVVAESHGASVDSVFDLPRMLRVPGTFNSKAATNGHRVQVLTRADIGGPLTLAEVDERLTEHGIYEEPDDRRGDQQISSPDGWRFADHTCNYVAEIIDGIPGDGPRRGKSKSMGRHQWQCKQAVRLACAYRLGCISETDWRRAQKLLDARLRELRAVTGENVPKYETAETMKLAIRRASAKTDDQARAELSDHEHSCRESDDSPEPAQPIPLSELHQRFRHWLGDHYDMDAINAVLATAAVERLDGDPLWLLIVSGPGAAKTETVTALKFCDGAVLVSTISSIGALLSATARKERAKDATGGLLKQLEPRGIMIIKDLTSILSMPPALRGPILAALREVYDGHYVREAGVDGGRKLPWHGRIAIVGAVTTAWDRAHEAISAMGDRFVLLRIDSTKDRIESGRRTIANTGHEDEMREELARLAAGVIAGVDTETKPETTQAEERAILAAANLVTQARTAVDTDYRGDVVNAHAPEMPTRFARQLTQVLRGAIAIGIDRTEALRLAIRCARDSMPPLRLDIIEDLAEHPQSTPTDVRKRLDKPRATIDRQLQALHILELVVLDEIETMGGFGKLQTHWHYTLCEHIDPTVVNPGVSVPRNITTGTYTHREKECESDSDEQ